MEIYGTHAVEAASCVQGIPLGRTPPAGGLSQGGRAGDHGGELGAGPAAGGCVRGGGRHAGGLDAGRFGGSGPGGVLGQKLRGYAGIPAAGKAHRRPEGPVHPGPSLRRDGPAGPRRGGQGGDVVHRGLRRERRHLLWLCPRDHGGGVPPPRRGRHHL